MARAAQVAGLSAQQRLCEAAASVLEARCKELEAHTRALLHEGGGEALHDVRVDLRRLRSLLEDFAPCFPERARRRAAKELKTLAAALGVARDSEVLEALLARHLALSAPAGRRALASLQRSIKEQRALEQQRLQGALAQLQSKQPTARLQRLAKHAREAR
ncbi:MAG TPA: CHAD domain-containing protein [Solirubrobacteraceae bacterium]|nr:CHAD domain-containing protein [Solirubrobacteraceae bacterium]